MNRTADGKYDTTDPFANIVEMHRRLKERQDKEDEKHHLEKQ